MNSSLELWILHQDSISSIFVKEFFFGFYGVVQYSSIIFYPNESNLFEYNIIYFIICNWSH